MFIKTSDKIKLYLKQSGQGTPCIFIHGGPGAWSKDFEIFCGTYLEKTMQMIYLDQRGCGRSTGDDTTDYSINRIIEDIEDVRKKLNIDKWILLAHSFGGIIATNYAKKYEKHVECVILVNCTLNMKASLQSQIDKGYELLKLDNKEYSNDLIGTWKNIAYDLIKKDSYYNLQYKDYNNYLKVNNIDNEMMNTSMSKQAFDNGSYFINYCNMSKYIKIPVLIIIGDEDYAIGVNHHKEFGFLNSITKTIKGKHTPYLEDTFELVSIINEFVFNLS